MSGESDETILSNEYKILNPEQREVIKRRTIDMMQAASDRKVFAGKSPTPFLPWHSTRTLVRDEDRSSFRVGPELDKTARLKGWR